MKKFFLMSAIIFAATISKADMNGTWAGTYSYEASNYTTFTYSKFKLSVAVADGMVTFSEPSGLTWLDGMQLTIDGNNLVLGDHVVGQINDNTISFKLTDDFDDYYDAISMTANADGSLTYDDKIFDLEGDYIHANFTIAASGSIQDGKHLPRGSVIKKLFDDVKAKAKK
jgi:hypothetical protein